MEHRQLLHFLAACEEKSFSSVAKQCAISQQGFSISIKQLEEELEVSLFLRTPQGIELTEYGRALQRTANSYINYHEEILSEMRELKQQLASRVSIALTDGFSDYFPPDFFNSFITDYPDIDLNISSFPCDICQSAMTEQNISLGFVDGPVNISLLDPLCCNRHKVYLMVGKTHRFARRSSVKLAELRGEKVIFMNNNMYPQGLITDLCIREGIKPSFQLGTSDYNLISKLCGTGLVVSFWAAPRTSFPNLLSITIDDFDAVYWEAHFVANRSVHLTEAAHAFIAYTREKVFTS
jgi:DNA-binding transcriptional LysR family regulator